MISAPKLFAFLLLGTVSPGLAGGGLVLQDAHKDSAHLSSNGSFLPPEMIKEVSQTCAQFINTSYLEGVKGGLKEDVIGGDLKKRNPQYNSSNLTLPFKYEQNIKILNEESTRISLRCATDQVILQFQRNIKILQEKDSTYTTALRHETGQAVLECTQDDNFLPLIQEALYQLTWARLLEEQQSFLKRAQESSLFSHYMMLSTH